MLTFTNVEPIIEAKKVPVQYRYQISILAMINMLVRLDYDPDALYIQNGRWDIPSSPTFANNIARLTPPSRVSGIGFFEDFNDEFPSIVMDVEKQKVCIIDERHINELNRKSNNHIVFLIISFDRIFGDRVTWKMIVNETTNDHIEKHDPDFEY